LSLGGSSSTLQAEILSRVVLRLLFQTENVKTFRSTANNNNTQTEMRRHKNGKRNLQRRRKTNRKKKLLMLLSLLQHLSNHCEY
jgi:hypothetical protein